MDKQNLNRIFKEHLCFLNILNNERQIVEFELSLRFLNCCHHFRIEVVIQIWSIVVHGSILTCIKNSLGALIVLTLPWCECGIIRAIFFVWFTILIEPVFLYPFNMFISKARGDLEVGYFPDSKREPLTIGDRTEGWRIILCGLAEKVLLLPLEMFLILFITNLHDFLERCGVCEGITLRSERKYKGFFLSILPFFLTLLISEQKWHARSTTIVFEVKIWLCSLCTF